MHKVIKSTKGSFYLLAGSSFRYKHDLEIVPCSVPCILEVDQNQQIRTNNYYPAKRKLL